MSKVYSSNRRGKGSITKPRESRINQARTLLRFKSAPTIPKSSTPLKKPKAKPKLVIADARPAGVSENAWRIIKKLAAEK